MENPENTDESTKIQPKPCSCLSLLRKYGSEHLKVVATVIVLVVIALIIIVVTCIVLTSNISPISPFDSVISREEWSALPAKPDIPDLILPVEMVIIAHTAEEKCNTKSKCLRHIRVLQEKLMTNPPFLSDIPYNFLIGGDGNAYEGRGWFKKGEHTKFYNNRSIGISFIGTFEDFAPTQQELQIAQFLIQKGVSLKAIAPDYKLYGACQVKNTKSPGQALFKIISKWPHWTEKKP